MKSLSNLLISATWEPLFMKNIYLWYQKVITKALRKLRAANLLNNYGAQFIKEKNTYIKAYFKAF